MQEPEFQSLNLAG